MKALIVLALLRVFWLINPKRRQRRVLASIVMVALFCFAMTSAIGVALADRVLLAPLLQDTGESVQSIVVLGRGEELRQQRIEVTEKLWHDKRSPTIFASGMLDAEFITEQLRHKGIPKEVVSGERCSQSTVENALFTSALLHPKQVEKILLITDAPHLLRSVLLFRSFGFTVIPHSISLPSEWSSLRQLLVVLRESIGLIKYAVTGEFKQRNATEIDTPPAEVKRKLVEWNCRL